MRGVTPGDVGAAVCLSQLLNSAGTTSAAATTIIAIASRNLLVRICKLRQPFFSVGSVASRGGVGPSVIDASLGIASVTSAATLPSGSRTVTAFRYIGMFAQGMVRNITGSTLPFGCFHLLRA